MTEETDPVNDLARAIGQTEAIISRVRPDQARLATPCPDWDVQALVDHVVKDVQMFTDRANRTKSEGGHAGISGDDWTGQYRAASDSLLAAWRRDGALDGIVELPFGKFPPTWFVGQQLADLVVHGWDIAKATGQPTEFDPELSRFALDWAKENLRPEYRGRDFGPEVPVPEDASGLDRLVGFFGRDPAWTAHGTG
jgi:uncharacterized protein (TIGR03086 family)